MTKNLGGRPRTQLDDTTVIDAHQAGQSISAIARDHGVDRYVIRRILHEADNPTTDNVLQLRSGSPLPDRADRDWVTSHELANAADITYRQLDYWSRTGLLTALPGSATAERRFGDLPITPENPGSGYLRRYHQDQITRAQVLSDLLYAGLSLQTCRHIIDDLLDGHQATLGQITITHHPGGHLA